MKKKKILVVGHIGYGSTTTTEAIATVLKASKSHNMTIPSDSASIGSCEKGILTIGMNHSLDDIERLIKETNCDTVVLHGADGTLSSSEVLEKIYDIKIHDILKESLPKPMLITPRPILKMDTIVYSDEYNTKSGKHMGKKHKHKNNKYF